MSAGAAEASQQFDPFLSLTGGSCLTVSALDPEPDPGCAGAPPPATFSSPTAVTTDRKGNIFVANFGSEGNGSEGRIDIFSATGSFITELATPKGPLSLAVDSKGVLYVVNRVNPRIVRYAPSTYNPGVGQIEYAGPPETMLESSFASYIGLAINKANDHPFADPGGRILEWKSHEEGGEPLPDAIRPGTELWASVGGAFAIDTERGRIYAAEVGSGFSPGPLIDVFDLDPPHQFLETIDGATVPGGEFSSENFAIAVDEGTGHVFVYDSGLNRVDELTEHGDFVGVIERGFQVLGVPQLIVDNGAESPNGALNPNGGRYLLVPSHPTGVGHVFAFGPAQEGPPIVDSIAFASVTETEAELRATINPGILETTYTVEYTTQEQFEVKGFVGAAVAGTGSLPAVNADLDSISGASALSPGTDYRFRVVAINAMGSDEGEGRFSTYPAESIAPCPTDPLRAGLSALLPDCRAYELVTPADTNARAPFGLGDGGPGPNSSPAGDKLSFRIEGGALPSTEATGSLLGDPYVSSRGPKGWSTAYVGPAASEAVADKPGSASPDQGYIFWNTGVEGSAVVGGAETSYIRDPDGHSKLVGRGSLGADPRASGALISEGGEHVIFQSGGIAPSVPQKLEPTAPPTGTSAIYDRTDDEVTHVVSLLPDDVTPSQGATLQGVSLDGIGVAFSIGSKLYLRYDNKETFEIGDGVTFAGVAEGGNRIFYLNAGQLLRFDALNEQTTPFNASGTAIPVIVSADGSAAYFASTTVLTAKANPNGVKAKAGQQNLYLSQEGTISFVGTVTIRDLEGGIQGSEPRNRLGLWLRAVGLVGGLPGRYAVDPSRTTVDGDTLLFESRANLTDYDSDEHAQVYRYDSGSNELQCLSCIPTGSAASGEASLLSISEERGQPVPLRIFAHVENLSADGNRAFFQTTEALVPRDTDGQLDVYEWEEGVGSCVSSGGCVYLLSSGQSDGPEYLYSVSDSGNDVFIWSGGLLLPSDTDETPSIYDARVEGGFVELGVEECQGEGCRPSLSPSPALSTPGMDSSGPSGNLRKPCPKGKRKVKRNGHVRCVSKKQGKHKRKDASSTGGRRR